MPTCHTNPTHVDHGRRRKIALRDRADSSRVLFCRSHRYFLLCVATLVPHLLMRRLKVPESGHPDDFGHGLGDDIPSMEEDDEGEVLQHEVAHGFRWYRVRVLTRSISTEVREFAESECVRFHENPRG